MSWAKQSSTGRNSSAGGSRGGTGRRGALRSVRAHRSRNARLPVRHPAGEHLGVGRQVVEEGRGFFEEQRQVVLDTGGNDAAGQVPENRAAPEIHVETLTKARLEAGDLVLLHRELAGRQQADRVDLVDRALGLGIEGAQGLDLIVEQVDPVGQLAAHGEQVDQGATHGELAMLVDRVDAAVAAGFQARAHLFDVDRLAHIQHQAAAQQEAGRGQAVQGGGDRHHEDAVIELRQPIETGDALGNDVWWGENRS